MDLETAVWITAPGLATGVGGLGIFVFRSPSERVMAGLLGFTAGVMLAATAFSLLVPALERGPLADVLIGFLLGAACIVGLDELIPHAHARFREGDGEQTVEEAAAEERAGLLLSALTIHNIPEGLAVGVAFAAGGTDLGIPIALAIGIQNIPEGFAAATPLRITGTSVGASFGVAALTGLVEPLAAFSAFGSLELTSDLLAPGLAFAGGAMIYVVIDELVPESHAGGFERVASIGFLLGFVVMMALDNAFG
jgi:ZIP family zinc transporter